MAKCSFAMFHMLKGHYVQNAERNFKNESNAFHWLNRSDVKGPCTQYV